MAHEQYRQNVSALCAEMNIKNPIKEKDVIVASVIFFVGAQELPVDATDMNRAGRLFVQKVAGEYGNCFFEGEEDIEFDSTIREWAVGFFTPELWDDCREDHRPVVYGFKNASGFRVKWKGTED